MYVLLLKVGVHRWHGPNCHVIWEEGEGTYHGRHEAGAFRTICTTVSFFRWTAYYMNVCVCVCILSRCFAFTFGVYCTLNRLSNMQCIINKFYLQCLVKMASIGAVHPLTYSYYVYVCMDVYMYGCIHVGMYICMYVYVCM